MGRGRMPSESEEWESLRHFIEGSVSASSIYRVLHDRGGELFPDELFADLYQSTGRISVPPRIVATVMVLQRIEGLSDREAVDRFAFDLRWKYAAGGVNLDYPGFVHTVLVDMRARLRESARPDRLFERVLDVCRAAGYVGRKRVMDSTALYDAVATQDTVTLIRSAIRSLLRVTSPQLEAELRAVLRRDDDYVAPGKPSCDWEDKAAREALLDALVRDAHAVLRVLHGRLHRHLGEEVVAAAELLSTVVGQDVEKTESGTFRIAEKVAKDRVLSVVDPEARHGHKSKEHRFDGYKGHISIDPDSELITATDVTAGNAADDEAAPKLLAECLPPPPGGSPADEGTEQGQAGGASPSTTPQAPALEAPRPEPEGPATGERKTPEGSEGKETQTEAKAPEAEGKTEENATALEVYGDGSYGTAKLLEQVEGRAEPYLKVKEPSMIGGLFSKSEFQVDLEAKQVTCPASQVVPIRFSGNGGGRANFGVACATCPLRGKCTNDKDGRKIRVHPKEAILARERERQKDPEWKKKYRATRPKVERKIAHLMRRKHGGRRARVRGRVRVAQDFSLLSAAINISRLAVLQAGTRG